MSGGVRNTFEMVREPTTVLVNVRVLTPLLVHCGRVPKLTEVVDKLATAAPVAVPDSATLWLLAELLSELSEKFRFAVSEPVALGMNATVTVQLVWAPRVAEQLLAC